MFENIFEKYFNICEERRNLIEPYERGFFYTDRTAERQLKERILENDFKINNIIKLCNAENKTKFDFNIIYDALNTSMINPNLIYNVLQNPDELFIQLIFLFKDAIYLLPDALKNDKNFMLMFVED